MEILSQNQVAERNGISSLASQISGLGYVTMQSLQGLSCKEDEAKHWRDCAEKLGLAFQAYCIGICNQMEAESEHVDGGLQSVIFQLGAIGDHARGHLNAFLIGWQRDFDGQRHFVSQAAIAIQEACDSISAQIGQEGKSDE